MDIINGNGFVAHITRSAKRKSIAIKVQKGQVYLVVPVGLRLKLIEEVVAKKTRWILEKLAHQQVLLAIPPKAFISGEVFGLLDQQYTLKIVGGTHPAITVLGGELVVSVCNVAADNVHVIRQLLIKWYRRQAEMLLIQKTDVYARVIGVTPSGVAIKAYKSRWGSCSYANSIAYNWKLVGAPERVVDYVVIHELCHILHHNHSPAFWQAVARYCPDYRERGAWLKNNGGRLEI